MCGENKKSRVREYISEIIGGMFVSLYFAAISIGLYNQSQKFSKRIENINELERKSVQRLINKPGQIRGIDYENLNEISFDAKHYSQR